MQRLDAVSDAESVAVLAKMTRRDKHHSESIAAIAMHADRAAATMLEQMAGAGTSDARGDALFWLGQRGDADAERAIRAALAPDVPAEVQKKAVFALSQLPASRAVPALRELFESDRPRAIRKEAMFWLAQHDSDEAFAVFERIFGK